MRWLQYICAAAIPALVLASCASVAHIEKDDDINFSNYRTYAWVEPKEDSAKGKISDLAEKSMKGAVAAELAKAGWKESKKADILLTYDVSVENAIHETNDAVYSQPATRYYYNPYNRRLMSVYYPSQFLGYDKQQQQVKEGTLTLSMIDAKTDKTIWQGWTTNEIGNKNLTSKEIQNSVKSIFKKSDLVKN